MGTWQDWPVWWFQTARTISRSARIVVTSKRAARSAGSCPLCNGTKHLGTTTFTADLGFGVVVIRRVPASVCSQCGADWIEDKVAEHIERLVEEARVKRSQVEVMALS